MTPSVTTISPAYGMTSTMNAIWIDIEAVALTSPATFDGLTTEVSGMSTTTAWDEIVASDGRLDWSLMSDESITSCTDISDISSRILLLYKAGQRFSSVDVRIMTKGHVVFSGLPNIIPSVVLTHESDSTDQSRSVFQNVPNLCNYKGSSEDAAVRECH